MFDLFLDIFAFREPPWTRLDPRLKLLITLTAILCLLLSTRMVLPLAFLGLSLSGMVALRLPARLIFLRLIVPMNIVALLILMQAITFGKTELWTIAFWGGSWTFWKEGFLQGLLLGSRVLGAVSVLLLFSSMTPAHTIFSALRWFRVPPGWVEVALLMYRYTFALLDRAADVAAAQKVRLGYSGVERSLSSLGSLAGIVLIHSFDQAARTYEAMILRGYKGSIPFAPLPAIPKKEFAYTILTCGAMGGITFLLR